MISTILLYFCLINIIRCLPFTYHNYEEMTELLMKWNSTTYNPSIRVNLYSIGKSWQERELWVLEVTAGANDDTSLPNAKLIGNMHGNEVVGREVLLHFIDFLLKSYSSNEEIKWFLDNTKLHIMPSLNPDGFEKAIGQNLSKICAGGSGRENSRNVDLNRNFPDFYHPNKLPTQPETDAVMKWMKKIPFILSAALHGGTIVANYPFDTSKTFRTNAPPTPSPSPDNDVFVHLAKTYANNHETMHKGDTCKNYNTRSDQAFDGGIVNGAFWYPFIGGMQDYNYFKHGCMEITLEISCCKFPESKELSGFWNANKQALTKYCLQANQGVTGIVLDKHTREPVNATLEVFGRDMKFYNSITGRFWRLLLPGSYNLSITANGYHNKIINFTISSSAKFPKLLDIEIHLLNSSIPISTTTNIPRANLSTTTIADHITDGARRTKSAPTFYENEIPSPIICESKSSSVKINSFVYLHITSFFVVLLIV